MTVNGKEVHFKATIRATLAIARICPGGDINRISELVGEMNADTIEASVKIICELSNGTLTRDEILDMEIHELQGVLDDAMKAFRKDQEPTVEVQVKKDEATEAQA